MEEYSVRDGVRSLEFKGILLAESTSRTAGKARWVEFELYRTAKQYVVSRVGVSVFYHAEDCAIVSRNKLSPVDGSKLSSAYVPCDMCEPKLLDLDGVYPETPRSSAWTCEDAISVVSSLMKEDRNRTEYLTNVARDLLIQASKFDPSIRDAFYIDRIE